MTKEQTDHTKILIFLFLILKQQREFRESTSFLFFWLWTFWLCSVIALTLSFLWLCFYSLPSRLCNTCLFLSAQSTLTPTSGMGLLFWHCIYNFWQKHSSHKPAFFLMLHCLLPLLKNNSIMLSFPFSVINFSRGLPPVRVSTISFLACDLGKNTCKHKWAFNTIVIYTSS